MENRYWNQWNPAKLLTDFLGNVSWTILKSKIPFDTQGWMLCRVPTTLHFLPSHHTNSMEERYERSSALGTTYMCYSMWIDTQPIRLNFSSILNDRWYEQFRRSCNSCPNTIGFQLRRDLHEHPHSAQHMDTQPVRLNFIDTHQQRLQ